MSELINDIFSNIANKYDFMGHFLSLGVDGLWRKMAAKEALMEEHSYNLLDVATGTGSLAIDIAEKAEKNNKKINITAIDINKDMLGIAQKKIMKLNLGHKIKVKLEDAMKLDEPNCYYDVVTAGFLLRNVDDTHIFVAELKRILKTGGKFILLEMGKAENKLTSIIFRIYFIFIRAVGLFIDRKAYWWLTHSIMLFKRKKMVEILQDNGFKEIKIQNLPFGIGFIITGFKL